ncbi:MarR family protein [Arthrobacter saudimassiliensis]|uniref:MarR family protein n=1 Tax=Arthrobacter saudimassiliensis TaxID=1461584 RepID=A0A078MSE8_9MICC|nr:MarR family protein [Arthrobacter saudimassiliensis]
MQDEGDWEAVRLLSTAARLVRRHMDNRLRSLGLTQERITVLRVLIAGGPLRRAELARRLRVTAQTLGTSLVAMADQGLVKEVGEGEGASRRAVTVTDHGRQMLREAEEIEQGGFVAELDPRLRKELVGLIRQLEVGRMSVQQRR